MNNNQGADAERIGSFVLQKGVKLMGRSKRSDERNERRNAEGYDSPTEYAAIKNLEKEEARFKKLLKTIFCVCELAGFEVEERIVVRDLKTGKVWR